MTDNRIIEEAIRLVKEGVSVTFPVNGVSMLPFIIGGRESLVLVKPGKPHIGEVVLAWVDGNRYVVHRIISIEGDDITLMGDGNVAGREYCQTKDIAARADYVVDAQGKKRYLYSKSQLFFSRLWFRLLPIRRYLLAFYKRIYRKIADAL